jgi:hypothetical protein
VCAHANTQARGRVDQLLKLGHVVDKVRGAQRAATATARVS